MVHVQSDHQLNIFIPDSHDIADNHRNSSKRGSFGVE